MTNKNDRHKNTINHLNKILGQMNVLKRYIEEKQPCHKIAQLTASITSSFSSLKIRTLNGYIQHELLQENLPTEKKTELEKILKLYKK